MRMQHRWERLLDLSFCHVQKFPWLLIHPYGLIHNHRSSIRLSIYSYRRWLSDINQRLYVAEDSFDIRVFYRYSYIED